MPVKSGLVLEGYHRLEVICRPLSAYLTRCYWVIDDQTGPFDSPWIYESPENEALHDRQLLDVPECENTSTTCWRPKTLPNLATHLVVDEWTYFFAIDAPEEEDRIRPVASPGTSATCPESSSRNWTAWPTSSCSMRMVGGSSTPHGRTGTTAFGAASLE